MDAEEADRAEIIDLIHRSRAAMWTQDLVAYRNCFVHADYTTRWNASARHGIFVRKGWDTIEQRVRHLFADTRFRNNSYAHDTTVENLDLRISGGMAWATYNQFYPGEDPGSSHEVRFFERHEGQWRIAFLGFLDVRAGRHDAPVLLLDRAGAVRWKSPAAVPLLDADEDLVIRNHRLRVRDSRADRSLQAAIKWAGTLDDSLIPGRGTLPIVLELGEGIPTKVWWVVAEGGAIFFSFADARLEDQRLNAAAAVYGLSTAQRQLAAHIVAGRPLAAAAEAMNITANTARTHLRRVFEKTGVHTQTALVRMLLSTVAPL